MCIINIEKLLTYVDIVSCIDPNRVVFTNGKPVRGCDIYNNTARRCPITGSVMYIKAKFKLRNKYFDISCKDKRTRK